MTASVCGSDEVKLPAPTATARPAPTDTVAPVVTSTRASTNTPIPAATSTPIPPAPPTIAPRVSNCNPNYSGACLDKPGDYDCAGGSGNGPNYVRGPIRVIGVDVYDLDRDHDGIACE